MQTRAFTRKFGADIAAPRGARVESCELGSSRSELVFKSIARELLSRPGNKGKRVVNFSSCHRDWNFHGVEVLVVLVCFDSKVARKAGTTDGFSSNAKNLVPFEHLIAQEIAREEARGSRFPRKDGRR